MRWSKAEVLSWESRWSLPVGVLTLLAVMVLVASAFVIGKVNGSGEAELLRSAHEHTSSVTLASILEAVGFVFLTAPLYFLFRAAAARSSQLRYQLVGLVIAAPLFFSVSAVLNATATNEGANTFVAGEAKSTLTTKKAGEECASELKEKGAKKFGEEFNGGASPSADCAKTKVEDNEASNALSEASTRGAATGFGLGGRLGLAVALVYSCLYAMRVGLLSRFWGSLGMALGVAALLLLVQFSLIWFIYFGLLLIGRIPGGRPPAWAAGEAVPWPTPGERAAAELAGSGGDGDDGEGPAGDGEDDGTPPALGNGTPGPGGERRKRKQRDS
jgi:hypothetical protein